MGGHRIRALLSETGAEVRTVSDEQMSVFAPTREAMEDLMERVETILQEEEEKEVHVHRLTKSSIHHPPISQTLAEHPGVLLPKLCTCLYSIIFGLSSN